MDTVLIIDDEENLRTLLARIISLEGYTVLEAGTLRSGFKILQKDAVDILLCDVKLPDGNGVAMINEFKLRSPLTEVIY
jgi:two-component system NtrC family response regulator